MMACGGLDRPLPSLGQLQIDTYGPAQTSTVSPPPPLYNQHGKRDFEGLLSLHFPLKLSCKISWLGCGASGFSGVASIAKNQPEENEIT